MVKNRTCLALAVGAAGLLWLGGSSSVFAQRPAMTDRGYREMRRLAQWLDATAQHAADQARHQDSWVYRHDSRFPSSVGDFARRADRFNERMAGYRASPWNVDDDLRSLLKSAQNVQALARRSREADEHTLSDWNDTVAVLNRMVRLYDFDVRRAGRYDWNAPLPDSREGWYGDGGRQGYDERRDNGRYWDGRRSLERVGQLARDLAERTARASQMTRDLPDSRGAYTRGYSETIDRFARRARDFDRAASSSQADPRTLREEARRLLEDARRTEADMRQNNAFPQVWGEWQGIEQTLEQIVDSLGA
jgi:hypothetical protein